MLKIGDFSKLARVSVRMLRHYDEIGLLKPAKIDRMTGYRYYREEQLPVVGRITALKDMGFSLHTIREMLECYADSARMEPYFLRHEVSLEAQLEETSDRLRLLRTARERLRKGKDMKYEVTVRTLPERYAACVRMTIPSYEAEGMMWGILCEETDAMNLTPDDPCICSAVFLDEEYREKDVEVEVQKTVKGSYPDTEHVRFCLLPPVQVASAVYKGSYEQIGEVNAAVAEWIEANGYDFAGPMFNIYHVSPHETQDPAEFVTEVCYPVQKKR